MKIGVLFDLDGTLLNTLGDIRGAVNHVLEMYDYPPKTLEEVKSFISNGAIQMIRLALAGRRSEEDIEGAVQEWRSYYGAHAMEKTKPYAGITEALGEISKKYPVAVVSNKPDTLLKPLVAKFFPGTYALGEQAGTPRKPAPDMVLKAMAAIGVDTCIYVGDSDVDVVTAANLGVPCISVTWGFREKSCLVEAGGKIFCDDPKDLPAMIETLAKGLLQNS